MADVPAFADEFNTLSLDTGLDGGENWAWRWVLWNAHALDGNADKAWKAYADYRPDRAARTPAEILAAQGGANALHEVSSGTLKLRAWPNPDAVSPFGGAQYFGYGYLGGMISSEMRHFQAEGAWEWRAKFKATTGQHWAMWLIQKDGAWPPEIDMVEIVGTGSNVNRLHMNAHGVPAGNTPEFFNGTDPGTSFGVPSFVPVADTAAFRDWHVYRFVWTPDWLEWHIDGLIRRRQPNYLDATKPVYFLITPEIASNWPGPPDGTTEWPMEAEIDYVRIYATAEFTEPPPFSFTEPFTGADGSAWDAARWGGLFAMGASVADIQGNQGRLLPQGGTWPYLRIDALTGDRSDIEITAKFTLQTGNEQYHALNVRHSVGWFGDKPGAGYRFMIYNGNLEYAPIVDGAPVVAQAVTVAKTWGTSQWNLRVRVVGTSIRARVWQGAEPSTWDIDVTSATHAAGIVSLVSAGNPSGTAAPILWDDLAITEPSVPP